MERRVLVIVGPTCSGKTSLSLHLSALLPLEIISADSRQFYKYLNIGTAKPDKTELSQTKHHLIDFLEPDEEYNASRFESDALKAIEEILNRNKLPLITGGSGLYIKAVVDGIFNAVGKDEDIRSQLLNLRTKHGNEYIYNKLVEVDPESAADMIPQNWKRIIRALEVFYSSGKPISELRKNYNRDLNIEFTQIGLLWKRETLYKMIEERVDSMIEKGLITEIKKILKMGYSTHLNSLNTVGYKEIIDYLEGNQTLERSIELIKRNTRRFAKRQMTWFNKDKRIKWHQISDQDDLFKLSKLLESEFT